MTDDPRAALERLLAETPCVLPEMGPGFTCDEYSDGRDHRLHPECAVAALLAPDARQALIALLAPTPEECGLAAAPGYEVTGPSGRINADVWVRYPAPTPDAT